MFILCKDSFFFLFYFKVNVRSQLNTEKLNEASVLENDSHKLLWDFNIQTDHLIPARRSDLIIINKRKRVCKIVDFAIQADHNKSEGK